MDWGVIAERLVLGYFGISIILEVLEIIFFLTPTPEDDKLIAKVKDWWEGVRKYFLLLSIRTPLTIVASIIFTVIKSVNEYLKRRLKRNKNL